MNVAEAARNGTERDLLIALRDRIAEAIADSNCPKRDLASLSLRLSNIVKEIRALDSAEGGDDIGGATQTPDSEFDAAAI